MRDPPDPPPAVRSIREDCTARTGEHRQLLEGGFEAGRRRYGALPLPFEVYARRVVELTMARRVELGEALPRLHAADLFLAIACDRVVDGAWDVFTRELLPRLRPCLQPRSATATDPATVLAELPGFLFTPPRAGARTRIGTYDGSGPLLTWLLVILRRREVDRLRERQPALVRPHDPGSDADLDVDPAAATANPLAVSIDRETEAILGRAFQDVWSELTAREALVLELAFRDRIPQQQIAGLLRVGAPRVSRLLYAAAAKLRSGVDSRLAGQPAVAPAVAMLRDSLSAFLLSRRQQARLPSDRKGLPHDESEQTTGS